MKQRNVKKKIGSLLLTAAMMITSFPASATEVHAADSGNAAPGRFVTKEQLMTFNTDDSDGSENPAKVYFGNNNQEWWIAGSQNNDSVTLFAASPLGTSQRFSDGAGSLPYSTDWGCSYLGNAPSTVNGNHYGGSLLREPLKELETSCFSTAEQALMKETTIYTDDPGNSDVYSTTDILYLAYGVSKETYITVGKNAPDNLNSGLRIDKAYWGNGWLRVPASGQGMGYYGYTMSLVHNQVTIVILGGTASLIPAFELDLSSVLFASAAKAASSDSAESGTIADDAAMTLRLDGADKTIGTASYDVEAGKIVAQKDTGATGTVSLVVQGKSDTDDWYYSVPAGEVTVVTKEQIETACSISGIDLAECKIWLETTEDSVTYAKMADARQSKFVTKEQLMTFNTDDSDGSQNPAKVYFGSNNQEWWIAGSQKDDSVTLFAASPLATGQRFDSNYSASDASTATKSYNTAWGCTYSGSAPSEVNANHYGASTLRTALKELETSYFSTAEQALMQATTIYTDDAKNSNVYSTTDKLYLAYAETLKTYITVGENASSNLNNGLHVDKEYWAESSFWLRAPVSTSSYAARLVAWGSAVSNNPVYVEYAVVPAFELDLSSVLFASAAKAASSDSAESGTIADGAAMTLRLDGADKTIGTASYDVEAGKIVAQKDTGAAGTVSLVVQGKGDTDDWYYSVPAGEVTVVTKEQIETACGISGIDLTECKIWLETTEDSVTYAKMADAKNFNDAATLAPGQILVRDDETITNGQNGTVTIDKGNDETVDVTVKLPSAGNIQVAADGKITVPAGATVQAAGGKELTLPNGGTVDADGNIEAEKIISGDTTVTAPEGENLTADKAGNITVPAGGTVETGDGNELTLPDGGTVDADGNIEADQIISGDITVTAPEGENLTADKAGNITVPAGGTVETGDGNELTLPNGGTVDADGNVEANKIISGDTTVTESSGEKVTVTADKDGKITVSAGATVETGDGNELTLPNGGTVDADGNVEADKIVSGDITVTAPEGENLTADKAGNITVPAGGTVETGDGNELTLPNGGTVDADGNIEADKIISGDITVTVIIITLGSHCAHTWEPLKFTVLSRLRATTIYSGCISIY